MTPSCPTHTTLSGRTGSLLASLERPDSANTTKMGFLPTTRIATPRGWQSVSSILPGNTVLSPVGTPEKVLDVQHVTRDPYDFLDNPEDRPVLIPSYALGNMTELCVLPDQSFHIPETAMGLQHLASFGSATARDLVGLNGIRTVDPEDLETAISLVFENETVISCAHGGLAVCRGAHTSSTSHWPALLAA